MVVGLLIGLCVGAAGVWLVLRARLATAEAALRNERELSVRFDALASDALRKNNETFLELAAGKLGQKEQAVEQLVAPIRDSLKQVDGKIQQLEVARRGAYVELRTQVAELAQAQKELRSETGNLVGALRDRPNVRGRWGEIQLRRVVEMAGMVEHCDFETQKHMATEDGRLRPDLVVSLPGGKSVVVDSKFAGQAYLESLSAGTDEERLSKLREHARQVRDHVTKLSHKSYWSRLDQTPEFVVLFIPGETYLSAALEQDPSLIEDGVNQQVIIATPTTLIALLQAVAHGWNQERIADSAEKLHALGSELYERLATLSGHFVELGKKLDGSVSAYNQAVGSLERRVLVSARRFPELGVTTKKEIPVVAPIATAAQPPQTVELPAARAIDAA